MGCWDVFCFICGNPCHGMFNNMIKETMEIFNTDINSKWTPYYKKLANKIKSTPNIINNLKDLSKNTKWMKQCTMLQINNDIIHDVKEVSCNNSFCNNKKCITHLDMGKEFELSDEYGVFIHTDCWKYIKDKFKIKLRYSDLPPVSKTLGRIFDIKYDDIEKYWQQDFDFVDIVLDKKEYLCSSPLKGDKNISNIKKIIKQLKIRNDPNRKGPMVSATFFKEGNIKMGNNNKFHVIKSKKWVEMPGNIIKVKIQFNINLLKPKEYKYLVGLKYIGEHTTEPIFINKLKNLKKGKYEIEFILLDSYREKLILV